MSRFITYYLRRSDIQAPVLNLCHLDVLKVLIMR